MSQSLLFRTPSTTALQSTDKNASVVCSARLHPISEKLIHCILEQLYHCTNIHNPTPDNMKFAAALLAIILPAQAWAWTYVDGSGSVFDGRRNVGCTKSITPAGKTFDWDRGFFEDCCIHLYAEPGCVNQVGFSCSDWKKPASRNLGAFTVTNC